jgi:hypothetical protein
MSRIVKPGGIKVYHELTQGSEEWLEARRGLLTASEMHLIVTPTLKTANNEKTRAHVYELLAQRITKYVEPCYIGGDMLRGYGDELRARAKYAEHYAPVEEVGFITNDKWGFTLGYSPDGLVGADGAIECKSRRQKFQVETIINGTEPSEHTIQLQTGLLVSERKWIDYISYSGGLPMKPIRVLPNPEIQDAILSAAREFEDRLAEKLEQYNAAISKGRFIETERTIEQEMFT